MRIGTSDLKADNGYNAKLDLITKKRWALIDHS